MSFIEKILTYKSLSMIGLEKNVGKTESMNYILKKLMEKKVKVGVTSIGIDGETVDAVTTTSKPEIIIYENMIFATSEKHYKEKKVQSEILDIGIKASALGRVVIGKARGEGKILLSGPSNGLWIKEIVDDILKKGMEIVIVDGALSRMSVGSPIITEAIILSTGAAVSLNINEIVKKTKHIIDLIKINSLEEKRKKQLIDLENGIYRVLWEKNIIEKLPIKSLLHFNTLSENFFDEKCSLYVTGALTERFLMNMSEQKFIKNIEIIVTDFTKIFSSTEVLNRFLKKGGEIKVLYKTELVAITVNPVSPRGNIKNYKDLIDCLKEFTDVPVLNLREE